MRSPRFAEIILQHSPNLHRAASLILTKLHFRADVQVTKDELQRTIASTLRAF